MLVFNTGTVRCLSICDVSWSIIASKEFDLRFAVHAKLIDLDFIIFLVA